MLQLSSNMVFEKNSFENVYSHGMVRGIDGVKMSKSLGNIISPDEVRDKYGTDAFRFYFNSLNAGKDISFSWDEIKIKLRNIEILLNTSRYLLGYAEGNKKSSLKAEDKWMLSRLNSTVKNVTELMDSYRIDETANKIEGLFLDLSRSYIKLVRDRIEEKVVVDTINKVLTNSLMMLSIISPFITEKIYLDLKSKLKLKEESVHLEKWPKYNPKLIDKKLEDEMSHAQDIIQSILAEREKISLGVRWPLNEVKVHTKRNIILTKEIIQKQTNIKKITIKKSQEEKIELDTKLTPELKKEGFTREMIRRIQELRKKANLVPSDKIQIEIRTKIDLDLKLIKKTVNSEMKEIKNPKITEKFNIKDQEFELRFNH